MNQLIPVKYLYLFADFLMQEHGFDLSDTCQQQGLTLPVDAAAFIENERFSQACEIAVNSVEDPILGLKFGSTLTFTHFGPLGAAMMSCKNIADILDLILEFSNSFFPFEIIVTDNQEHVSITQNFPAIFSPFIQFHIQTCLAGTILFFKEAAGFIPERITINFPYPEPEADLLLIYEKYLPVSLHFNKNILAIHLPKSYLEQPLPRYDEVSKQIFIKVCQDIQQRLKQEEKLTGHISNLLDAYETYPSIEQLAQILNISARTLRNRLQKEQTSFRKIIGKHRLQRAKALLSNSDLTIESIAEKVAYGDTPSFYRAFKKETNRTPLEYRSQTKPKH